MRILEVEGILPAAMGEAVDLQKLVGKDVVEHHVAQAAAALAHSLGLGQRREPQRHQELQGGDLGLMLLGGVEGHCGPSENSPESAARAATALMFALMMRSSSLPSV